LRFRPLYNCSYLRGHFYRSDLQIIKNFGTKSFLDRDNQENETEPLQFTLHPFFVSGLADARASFLIKISQDAKMRNGVRVEVIFSIILPKKEIGLLKLIQLYFGGVGKISAHGKSRKSYTVRTLDDLTTVLTHFDSYPLLTTLGVNFELFKRAVEIIKVKGHLTTKGLEEIKSLKLPEDLSSDKTVLQPDLNSLPDSLPSPQIPSEASMPKADFIRLIKGPREPVSSNSITLNPVGGPNLIITRTDKATLPGNKQIKDPH